MRYAIASVVIALMLVGSIFLNYTLAEKAVNASQHNWCDALELLTSKPVPQPSNPRANQSRETAFVFYENLKTLEIRFHC